MAGEGGGVVCFPEIHLVHCCFKKRQIANWSVSILVVVFKRCIFRHLGFSHHVPTLFALSEKKLSHSCSYWSGRTQKRTFWVLPQGNPRAYISLWIIIILASSDWAGGFYGFTFLFHEGLFGMQVVYLSDIVTRKPHFTLWGESCWEHKNVF